jgi:hypothetical protein
MASEAQIMANRRNALASTGPKSLDGKGNSRLNALRHGLAAKHVVAMDERGGDFAAYHDDLIAALSPHDAFEAALVRRLALLSWRLDRLCRIEAVKLTADYSYNLGRGKPGGDVWPEEMPQLARYESALDRAFKRTMGLLERRQALRRLDASAGAPAAASAALSLSAERPTQILILQNEPNLASDGAGLGAAGAAQSGHIAGDGGSNWRSDP